MLCQWGTTLTKPSHDVGSDDVAALNGDHVHPIDFFCGSVVTNKVYEKNSNTVDKIKEFILESFYWHWCGSEFVSCYVS